MSNKNNDNKYPAFHAPSIYAEPDFLEVVMLFAAFFGGMAGCAWLIQALLA